MTTGIVQKNPPKKPFAIGRPRWENLLLIFGLAVFWGGVILKFIS